MKRNLLDTNANIYLASGRLAKSFSTIDGLAFEALPLLSETQK